MIGTDAAAHRRWTNRDLHRDPDRHGNRWNWRLVVGMLIATTPIAAYLQLQNLCVQLNYEVDRLRAEQGRLEQELRRLTAHRAALEAPASIESWAATRRLERPPASDLVVVVRTSSGDPDLVVSGAAAGAREASGGGMR
jgi:cell division protein FtsL